MHSSGVLRTVLLLLVLLIGSRASYAQWNSPVSGTAENLNEAVFTTATDVNAVGENGVVLRSTDTGATWSTTGLDQDLSDMVFLDANTAVGIGKAGTLLRSVNGGISWSIVGSGVVAKDLLAVDASGTTAIAVGKVDGGASTIAYSTNSGATWNKGTVAADPGKDLFDITVLSATDAVAVGQADGGVSTVLLTTDSGANWTLRAVTADPGEDLFAVDASGSTAIGVGKNGVIVYSTDSGATWGFWPNPSKRCIPTLSFRDLSDRDVG